MREVGSCPPVAPPKSPRIILGEQEVGQERNQAAGDQIWPAETVDALHAAMQAAGAVQDDARCQEVPDREHHIGDIVSIHREERDQAHPGSQQHGRKRDQRRRRQQVGEGEEACRPQQQAVMRFRLDMEHLAYEEDARSVQQAAQEDQCCTHARVPARVAQVVAEAVCHGGRQQDDPEFRPARHGLPVRSEEEDDPEPDQHGAQHAEYHRDAFLSLAARGEGFFLRVAGENNGSLVYRDQPLSDPGFYFLAKPPSTPRRLLSHV